MADYHFPVFGTQGGGLAREVNGSYIFVEPPPDFPNMTVGSEVPEEWGLVPANQAARDLELDDM